MRAQYSSHILGEQHASDNVITRRARDLGDKINQSSPQAPVELQIISQVPLLKDRGAS